MNTAVNPLLVLAGFSSAVQPSRCPESTVRKARSLLLYGLAAGITSANATAPRSVAAALRREYGPAGGNATCLAGGMRVSMGAAAFANAVLLHVRMQDDAHPAGHMGTVILPAALALAEAKSSTGRDLLAAIISGYEVALRIGRDHAADLSGRGFRTTPIYGAFGAAAACARLLELDAQRTAHALALTTHGVGGLREFADAGTDEYPFQAGFGARSGLTCALLADEGIAGAPTALTGRAGFFHAFAGKETDYAKRLLDGLGINYELERVTYKPYPGGQFHRGVIRGFAALREQAAGARLVSAQVLMHPFEAAFLGLDYNGPYHTYAQAFYSVPFCAALAWIHGTVTFAGLNQRDAAEVLDIVARTRVISDAGRERYKPLARVTLDDGRVLEWADDPGEDSYTLNWETALDMTHRLCAEAGVAPQLATALAEAVAHVDAMQDIAPLIAAAARIAEVAVARI